MVADESQHSLVEHAFGHPLEQLVEAWAKTTRFFFQLADELRQL